MHTAPSVEAPGYQPPSWQAILAAHVRIAPRIHRTPVLTSASLNAIAKRAGVANAMLYRHFPTREELVLAVY